MTCANAAQPLGLTFGNFSVRSGIPARGLGMWVGTPSQVIAMRPSTGDDYTWVQNAATCSGPDDLYCIGNYGGVYNYSTSSTFSSTIKATWNGTGLSDNPADPPDSFIYFNDRIQFGSNGSIFGFPMITQKQTYITGDGVGIGANSTFLDQAVKTGAAPSRNWGLWVGSRSVEKPVDGSLWIGGYDTNRVSGNFQEFNAPTNCEFCVQITDMTYQYNGGSQSLFSNSSQALSVALQPYTRFLEVPSDIYSNLIRVTQAQGAFISNLGGATFYRNASMGNLSVTLNNGYKTVIPSWELFMPRQTVNAKTGVLEIQDGAPLTTQFYNTTAQAPYVLNWGMPYLAMNYIVTDWDNKKFKMSAARQGGFTQSNGALVAPLCSGIAPSTATPVVVPSGSGSSSPTPPSSSSGSSNVGAIAGGVVGGVAGLILIAVLAWWILRTKRREKALKEERDAALAGGSEAGHPQQEVMSQTGTTPTVVSSVYGGGKAYPYDNSVNGWLQSQNGQPSQAPQPYPHAYPVAQPPSEVPSSPHYPQHYPSPQPPSEATFASPGYPQAQAGHPSAPTTTAPTAGTTATMSEPFEMPAYQYR